MYKYAKHIYVCGKCGIDERIETNLLSLWIMYVFYVLHEQEKYQSQIPTQTPKTNEWMNE